MKGWLGKLLREVQNLREARLIMELKEWMLAEREQMMDERDEMLEDWERLLKERLSFFREVLPQQPVAAAAAESAVT